MPPLDTKVQIALNQIKNKPILIKVLGAPKCQDAGATALAAALKENTTVKSLTMQACRITAAGVEELVGALSDHPSIMDVEFNSNMSRAEGARFFAELIRTNKKMTRISLADNALGDIGCTALAEALKESNVRHMELGDNDITEKGCIALAAAIRAGTKLANLNLSGNPLGDLGLQVLCDVLALPGVAMKELTLNVCELGAAGAQALLDVLKVNATVTAVHLESNPNVPQSLLDQINSELEANQDPDQAAEKRKRMPTLAAAAPPPPSAVAPVPLPRQPSARRVVTPPKAKDPRRPSDFGPTSTDTYTRVRAASQSAGGSTLFASGIEYTGEQVNGTAHGQGVAVYPSGAVYSGSFENGVPSGAGKCTYKNMSVYHGQYQAGHAHGDGTYTKADGCEYSGQFQRDQYNGRGIFTNADGARYEGVFRDGKLDQKGKVTFPNGDTYVGEFRSEQRHGCGAYLWANGNAYYGQFNSDQMDGYGHFETQATQFHMGQYREDMFNGLGYLASTESELEGVFEANAFVSKADATEAVEAAKAVASKAKGYLREWGIDTEH